MDLLQMTFAGITHFADWWEALTSLQIFTFVILILFMDFCFLIAEAVIHHRNGA